MSRPGIRYHEVAAAAQQLTAQGKNPTIESIRILTGTGSSTTIAQHLKEWKAKQDHSRLLCDKENLPEEIVLTMKGLWERVIDQGEEKVRIIQHEFDETLTRLSEQNNTLEADNRRWQQQHFQVTQEKDSLIGDKVALAQQLRLLEDEKIALTVSNNHLTKQLQEHDERIVELQRLNQQVQANLEHYREASREQRQLDQQRFEHLQTQLETTIVQLKQELTVLQQKKNQLQQQCEQLHYATTTLQHQHDQLVTQNETLTSQLQQVQTETIQHAHAKQHWQQEYQKAQEKADEQHTAWIHLQTQLAVVTQQLTDTQRALQEVNDQYKLLAHEKWVLGQENAQLIGQLRQFEKMCN